jgi:hypothetical protein
LNSWEPPNNFGIISMLHTHTHTQLSSIHLDILGWRFVQKLCLSLLPYTR